MWRCIQGYKINWLKTRSNEESPRNTSNRTGKCCLVVVIIFIIANLVVLDIALARLKFDLGSTKETGLFRTFVSPDGKPVGILLNSSEISARETCEITLIAISPKAFLNAGYDHPCCFDLGAQSALVGNVCRLRQIYSSSIGLDSSWMGDWNACHWKGVACDQKGDIIELHLQNTDLSNGINQIASLKILDIIGSKDSMAQNIAILCNLKLQALSISQAAFDINSCGSLAMSSSLESLSVTNSVISGQIATLAGFKNLNSLVFKNNTGNYGQLSASLCRIPNCSVSNVIFEKLDDCNCKQI